MLEFGKNKPNNFGANHSKKISANCLKKIGVNRLRWIYLVYQRALFIGQELTRLSTKWSAASTQTGKKIIHYTAQLVDSNVPKLSASNFVPKVRNSLHWNFWKICANFLAFFVPNSDVLNIWAHIYAYLFHKYYFSFIPNLYCFERHSTSYISKLGLLVKIWQWLSTKWSAAGTGLLRTTCIWLPCCCIGIRM